MRQTRRSSAPLRVFSAANWAYATLPLMGLALPDPARASVEEADLFAFAVSAPDPEYDLIDILPGLARHFGSVSYQTRESGLGVDPDGTVWIAVPEDAPDPPADAGDESHPPHDTPPDDPG